MTSLRSAEGESRHASEGEGERREGISGKAVVRRPSRRGCGRRRESSPPLQEAADEERRGGEEVRDRPPVDGAAQQLEGRSSTVHGHGNGDLDILGETHNIRAHSSVRVAALLDERKMYVHGQSIRHS